MKYKPTNKKNHPADVSDFKKQNQEDTSNNAAGNAGNQERQFQYWNLNSFWKGSPGRVFIDEILVYYSLN